MVGPLAASAMIYKYGESNAGDHSPASLQKIATYLGVDLAGVFTSDNLLDGSRNEDIAWLVHQIFTFVRQSTRESNNRSMFVLVVFQSL